MFTVNPPQYGEPFENVLDDFDKYVKPHSFHFLHPQYHGTIQNNTSYESILAEMMISHTATIPFSWVL